MIISISITMSKPPVIHVILNSCPCPSTCAPNQIVFLVHQPTTHQSNQVKHSITRRPISITLVRSCLHRYLVVGGCNPVPHDVENIFDSLPKRQPSRPSRNSLLIRPSQQKDFRPRHRNLGQTPNQQVSPRLNLPESGIPTSSMKCHPYQYRTCGAHSGYRRQSARGIGELLREAETRLAPSGKGWGGYHHQEHGISEVK